MGYRKVIVKRSAAENIAAVSWYIESKGLIITANKFIDELYNYFQKLSNDQRSYAICKESTRAILGYKCIAYRRKYTVVFIESDEELIICEFISSKLIVW